MMRRPSEPEETIELVVNGFEHLDAINKEITSGFAGSSDLVGLEEVSVEDDIENSKEVKEPVCLVFGENKDSAAFIPLAFSCGFKIVIVKRDLGDEVFATDEYQILNLSNYENIVKDCDIGRNTFVCIFLEDATDCELILTQCLASDAYYIGLNGSISKVERILAELKSDGAPDTEIAAIAAPMGLNLGAVDPAQHAVAVVAEMLAAKSGKLKRLRFARKKD